MHAFPGFITNSHPEPVTNDDEFELLLSRSKFFKNYFVVLIEVLCCNFYKLPKFLPFYQRKVEKSKGGNQKYFLSILKASIIKKQENRKVAKTAPPNLPMFTKNNLKNF